MVVIALKFTSTFDVIYIGVELFTLPHAFLVDSTRNPGNQQGIHMDSLDPRVFFGPPKT